MPAEDHSCVRSGSNDKNEYRPRNPEESLLYRTIAAHLETFLAYPTTPQQKRRRTPRGTDETTATSRGADVAHCDERQKPADAAQRHARNYAWSELMKRVFNQPTNCIACRRNVRPCPDHSSVPSALRAGNRFRQSYTAMG